MAILEDIYLHMPLFIQEQIINLEGGRLSRRRYSGQYKILFDQFCRRYLEMTEDQLLVFQEERIRTTLIAASKIGYWSGLFKRCDVNVHGDPLRELAKLPILTKEELKKNVGSFSDGHRRYRGKVQSFKTSGTTGSGLHFYRTDVAEKAQWAVWWRYRMWHGIDRNTWCGYFGGRQLLATGKNRGPFYRVNSVAKQVMFSAYHLKADTILEYLKALEKYRIRWLHGYPSMISLFCDLIKELNISPPEIKTISFGSENLTEMQIRKIKSVFTTANVIDHYGQAEGVANFSQNADKVYVVDEDFSYVEFLPYENDTFRVIGTTFYNLGFPLLRYDTGDLVSGLENDNRGWRTVASIDGRNEDYVLLPSGVKIGRLDHIFKELIEIREAQIIQYRIDHVVISIVWNKVVDKAGASDKLIREARKRLGGEIGIEVTEVKEIQKSKSGKHRLVLNKLKS